MAAPGSRSSAQTHTVHALLRKIQLRPITCTDCACVGAKFEEPTDQVQLMREALEVQRMLACPWLLQLATEAVAVLAAHHQHTHTPNGHAFSLTTPNGHAYGLANGHSYSNGDSNAQARAGVASSLALSSVHVARAHRELRITPQQESQAMHSNKKAHSSRTHSAEVLLDRNMPAMRLRKGACAPDVLICMSHLHFNSGQHIQGNNQLSSRI